MKKQVMTKGKTSSFLSAASAEGRSWANVSKGISHFLKFYADLRFWLFSREIFLLLFSLKKVSNVENLD